MLTRLNLNSFVKMTKRRQSLRALVSERLTAAAEEIFALVERTIAEYEEELCRSKEENQRRQQLLDSALSRILVHRIDAQVQTETERPHPQQEASDSPHIKEHSDISTHIFDVNVKTESEEQETGASISAELPGSSSGVQFKPETAGDQYNAVQSKPSPSEYEYEGCSSITDEDQFNPVQPTLTLSEHEDHTTQQQSTITSPAEVTDSVKKHQCCFCGRRFREEHNLARHIVVHTRLKPFVCAVCSRCFSQEETLRLHMALHAEGSTDPASNSLPGQTSVKSAAVSASRPTKVAPFSCPVCDKRFTRTFSLQSHMLTHTGEKPFPCPLCSTRFNRKSNLNRHLKVHAQKYHNV